MRVKWPGRTTLLLAMLFVMGCAPVISKTVRDQVDKNLTFREVFKDPDAHKGSVVVWAGVIIDAKNTQEGTLIEILQKPAVFICRFSNGIVCSGEKNTMH